MGYKLAGIPGMLVSVIGAIIPPMVILSVISVFYDAFCSNYYIAALLKGMTAGVGAVIMSVVYDMGKNVVKSKDWVNVVIMIISFCLSYFLNVNIIYIILLVAVFGMVRTIVKRRQGKMIYIQLFLSFLQVGALSFGGGYAAMPLIQEQVVNLHSWLSMSEFTNLITIAEMTPGPIAVNSATFVGMQIAGILGAIIATLGCILPSCIIVTLLAYVYMKYRNMSLLQGTLASLRPAVVSMIAKAGVTILISAFFIDGTVNLIRQNVCVEMIIFFVIALVLLRKFKINPILAMVLCGVANVVFERCKKSVNHYMIKQNVCVMTDCKIVKLIRHNNNKKQRRSKR